MEGLKYIKCIAMKKELNFLDSLELLKKKEPEGIVTKVIEPKKMNTKINKDISKIPF